MNGPLLGELPLSVSLLGAGDYDNASDVWRARLPPGSVIVRASRVEDPETASPFMCGLHALFGNDTRNLSDLAALHGRMGEFGAFEVPGVLGVTRWNGREVALVEDAGAGPSVPFEAADLEDLGARMARLHVQGRDHAGHLLGHRRVPLTDFHAAMVQAADLTIRRFDGTGELRSAFEAWARETLVLPAPLMAAPMLLDLDSTQFVWEGKTARWLVDLEAAVLAPPELDLCAWEYVLDAASAERFRAGYERVCALPRLDRVRSVYRFFLRVLEVQGGVPLEAWLTAPTQF